jgi:hypothetical protein
VSLLSDVIEACESDIAVRREQAWQVAVAAHRHDRDVFGLEVATAATRERLDGQAVARAFDEHCSSQLHACIRSGADSKLGAIRPRS